MNLPPTPPPPRVQPLNYASANVSRSGLRAIASYQRTILLCILGWLALVVFQFSLPPSIRVLLAVPGLGVLITGAIYVFRLATRVYSTGIGILLGILSLIPLLGLIVLLVVNQKATSILRQHGVAVGLLGADPDKVA